MNQATPASHTKRPFISVQGVSIRLHDSNPFQDLNWAIYDNQHWAIIGPNGSGKSTLMKAICGSVPAVTGKIIYHFWGNGATPKHAGQTGPPQDSIAYVTFDHREWSLGHESPFYQARWNNAITPDTLTVSEYLSESQVKKINPYQVVDSPSDGEEFIAQRDRVVDLLGIGPLMGKNTIQISNGERRKVLIARALLKRPKLFILDNPFAGLDERFRAELKAIIGRLMQDEMRVMVVATDGDEIPPGITHVLLVESGQIVAQGPTEEIQASAVADEKHRSARPTGIVAHAVQARRMENREKENRILVDMDRVNISYNGHRILRQISWTVREGQHWALLGPNGAGKTTLLSLILGDNPLAYANNVTVLGRRRGSGETIWDIKKQIGWVAPELHLYYPKATPCTDVVCSGFFDSVGLYQNCSEDQRKTATQWMQHLGLAHYAGVAFGEVSEGEQRMLLLARALVKHPLLLILDEPCQGLDASNRDRILRTIDTIANRLQTSLIYVTHDQNALPQSITHVLRLDSGRIVDKDRMHKPAFQHGVSRPRSARRRASRG